MGISTIAPTTKRVFVNEVHTLRRNVPGFADNFGLTRASLYVNNQSYSQVVARGKTLRSANWLAFGNTLED